MLISKLAKCTLRLMKTQKVKNGMLGLNNCEAGHQKAIIKNTAINNITIIP